MSATRYSIIMWDLDGCLLDSSSGIIESMSLTFEEFGIPYEKSDLKSTIGISWPELFVTKYGMSKKNVEDAVLFCRRKFIDEGRMENAKVFEGIPTLLSEISREGIPQCIVTAKPQSQAEKILKTHDLAKYFDQIHGAELTGGATKADMIRQILQGSDIGNPRHAVMTDDRASGVNAAKEAGVVAVGIRHGYAKDGELEEAQPDHLVADAAELRNLLLP